MPTRRRLIVADSIVTAKLVELRYTMQTRLEEKGDGTFASSHEIYGVLAEEMAEFLQAIQQHKTPHELKAELMDIAVGAVFGIACIEAGGMDSL